MFTVPALVSTLVSTHVGATSRVHYPRQNVARVGAKSRVREVLYMLVGLVVSLPVPTTL